MNQPGYQQLSQSEQLAKRQDHERKNLEHSQDEQRKNWFGTKDAILLFETYC
jgi:hypothetical protein